MPGSDDGRGRLAAPRLGEVGRLPRPLDVEPAPSEPELFSPHEPSLAWLGSEWPLASGRWALASEGATWVGQPGDSSEISAGQQTCVESSERETSVERPPHGP